MPLNRFPNISKTNIGRDWNFFEKIDVNWSNFGENSIDGEQPDMFITFNTQGVMILNEGSGIVEFSFNGNTVHGELDSTKPSVGMVFDNRIISKIYFRLKSGSPGPIKVSVNAWGNK